MSIVPTAELRTLPCPSCGTILFEGKACPSCGLQLDAEAARAAADLRDRYLQAFSHAHALVITARSFLMMFGFTLLPFLRLIGIVGVPALLVWVPASAALWYWRYGRFRYDDPEYRRVRRWVLEALAIWVAAAVATPFWFAP